MAVLKNEGTCKGNYSTTDPGVLLCCWSMFTARDMPHPVRHLAVWTTKGKHNTVPGALSPMKHPWRTSCQPGTSATVLHPKEAFLQTLQVHEGNVALEAHWEDVDFQAVDDKNHGNRRGDRKSTVLDLRTTYREFYPHKKKTLYKALILSVNSFSVKSMTLLSGHHSRYKRVKALAYWPKMPLDGKTSNSLVVCPPWEMKGHLQHPTSLWSRKLQSISDTLNSATRMLTIKKRR